MKAESEMTIYLLSGSLEWGSLMGDKYLGALPFPWSITEELENAQVIVWDGMVSPKSSTVLSKVKDQLVDEKKILLLHREAFTLYSRHPFIEWIDFSKVNFIEMTSGPLLPEDILSAIELCHKKLNHV